ncbi:unnamed protein product [Merluccius merluccius]
MEGRHFEPKWRGGGGGGGFEPVLGDAPRVSGTMPLSVSCLLGLQEVREQPQPPGSRIGLLDSRNQERSKERKKAALQGTVTSCSQDLLFQSGHSNDFWCAKCHPSPPSVAASDTTLRSRLRCIWRALAREGPIPRRFATRND